MCKWFRLVDQPQDLTDTTKTLQLCFSCEIKIPSQKAVRIA